MSRAGLLSDIGRGQRLRRVRTRDRSQPRVGGASLNPTLRFLRDGGSSSSPSGSTASAARRRSPGPDPTDLPADIAAQLEYVDAPDSDLVCAVCQSPFQNAVEIDECGHMFCDRCVRRWIGTNPTCPVCRVRLHPSQLRPANRVIKNLVDKMVVRCPYSEAGCEETVRRDGIGAHWRRCDFRPLTCSAAGCSVTLTAADIETHELSCEMRVTECSCGQSIIARDLEEHRVNACLDARVTCSECGAEYPRREEISHISRDCESENLRCPKAVDGCRFVGDRDDVVAHAETCHYHLMGGFVSDTKDAIKDLQRSAAAFARWRDDMTATLGDHQAIGGQVEANIANMPPPGSRPTAGSSGPPGPPPPPSHRPSARSAPPPSSGPRRPGTRFHRW